MIFLRSILQVADSSSILQVRCISEKREIGRILTGAIRVVQASRNWKRGQKIKGLVVRRRKPTVNLSGLYVSFRRNSIIIMTEKGGHYSPSSSRIKGPIPYKLRLMGFAKVFILGGRAVLELFTFYGSMISKKKMFLKSKTSSVDLFKFNYEVFFFGREFRNLVHIFSFSVLCFFKIPQNFSYKKAFSSFSMAPYNVFEVKTSLIGEEAHNTLFSISSAVSHNNYHYEVVNSKISEFDLFKLPYWQEHGNLWKDFRYKQGFFYFFSFYK